MPKEKVERIITQPKQKLCLHSNADTKVFSSSLLFPWRPSAPIVSRIVAKPVIRQKRFCLFKPALSKNHRLRMLMQHVARYRTMTELSCLAFGEFIDPHSPFTITYPPSFLSAVFLAGCRLAGLTLYSFLFIN